MGHLPVPRFFVSGELSRVSGKTIVHVTVQPILLEPNERSDIVDHDLSEVTEQMTFAVKPCTSKFVPAPCPSVARCYGHAILSASIPSLQLVFQVQQNKPGSCIKHHQRSIQPRHDAGSQNHLRCSLVSGCLEGCFFPGLDYVGRLLPKTSMLEMAPISCV
jgi:hypothetical protein